MSANWIAVACATHVGRGVAGGFMQVCHGRAVPLRRIAPGDRVVYYSPTVEFGSKDRLQSFTAVGLVKGDDAYRVDMGGGFCPYRRDVAWVAAHPAPIKPLIEQLALCAGKRNWGYQFRFGLLAVSDGDMAQIACAMGAVLPAAASG
jgi:EVE domain